MFLGGLDVKVEETKLIILCMHSLRILCKTLPPFCSDTIISVAHTEENSTYALQISYNESTSFAACEWPSFKGFC